METAMRKSRHLSVAGLSVAFALGLAAWEVYFFWFAGAIPGLNGTLGLFTPERLGFNMAWLAVRGSVFAATVVVGSEITRTAIAGAAANCCSGSSGTAISKRSGAAASRTSCRPRSCSYDSNCFAVGSTARRTASGRPRCSTR